MEPELGGEGAVFINKRGQREACWSCQRGGGSSERFVRADVGVRMEEDSEKIDLIGRLALIRVSAELWIRSDRMGEKKGRTSAHRKKP